MKRLLLICALTAAAAVAAQAPAPKPTIVLPPKIVVGEIATLAVLDAQGALLAGATIEFPAGGSVTTDATGRARFTAPSQQGVLTAQLAGVPGVRASAVVIAAGEATGAEIAIRDYPRVVARQDRFHVSGSGFNGQADANEAQLGGQPAVVLAASPVVLVMAASPQAVPGVADLTVASAGKTSAPVRMTLVAVEVEPAAERVTPGKKAALMIRARGSELPLEIAVLNLTPEVIEFTRGEPLRIVTRGGPDNSAAVEIRGRREGDYAISARLVPSAVGLPDLSLARNELLAARKLTVGAWEQRISRTIRHLEEHPQHFLDVQLELEKMLADLPSAEIARHVEAAWLALLKR